MKKKYLFMLLCTTMLTTTSCEKEGMRESSIYGLYYHENTWCSRDAYHFTSKNSVIYYANLISDPNDTWGGGVKSVSFEERSGWYRHPYLNKWTLTYYIVDNKVYIYNGDILTISGNTLIKDGDGEVFRIWE